MGHLCEVSQIIKLDNRFTTGQLNTFLGVHMNAPNLAVQADMLWLNVQNHYRVYAIRYWDRLLQMDTERLT